MTPQRDASISAWSVRAAAALFSAFGVLALLLATIGVYGLKAYDVSRRTREIGIRMALGATGRDVERLVMREGMRTTIIGLAIGLLLAAASASCSAVCCIASARSIRRADHRGGRAVDGGDAGVLPAGPPRHAHRPARSAAPRSRAKPNARLKPSRSSTFYAAVAQGFAYNAGTMTFTTAPSPGCPAQELLKFGADFKIIDKVSVPISPPASADRSSSTRDDRAATRIEDCEQVARLLADDDGHVLRREQPPSCASARMT